MAADLFMTYAWTTDQHREWVRMLAATVRALGYDLLIDEDVDYGDSLTGFMRQAMAARHVMMIADENYVQRADSMPGSGVGIENKHISDVYDTKPPGWLSTVFKDNPGCPLPAWLTGQKPKGFDFSSEPAVGKFPGSLQVKELLRWLDDLPARKEHAVPVQTLRERAARLERIEAQRDPATWRNPLPAGRVQFEYNAAPRHTFWLGHGDTEFAFSVSDRSAQQVAVYADYVKAVGLVRSGTVPVKDLVASDLAAHLRPGRVVDAGFGDSVVLMNAHGRLCRVDVHFVQPEVDSDTEYTPASVRFAYEILQDS